MSYRPDREPGGHSVWKSSRNQEVRVRWQRSSAAGRWHSEPESRARPRGPSPPVPARGQGDRRRGQGARAAQVLLRLGPHCRNRNGPGMIGDPRPKQGKDPNAYDTDSFGCLTWGLTTSLTRRLLPTCTRIPPPCLPRLALCPESSCPARPSIMSGALPKITHVCGLPQDPRHCPKPLAPRNAFSHPALASPALHSQTPPSPAPIWTPRGLQGPSSFKSHSSLAVSTALAPVNHVAHPPASHFARRLAPVSCDYTRPVAHGVKSYPPVPPRLCRLHHSLKTMPCSWSQMSSRDNGPRGSGWSFAHRIRALFPLSEANSRCGVKVWTLLAAFPPPPTASCHIRWGHPQASHQGCRLLFHRPQLHNREALRFASMVYQLKITCRAEALCGAWGAEWAPGKVIGEERGLLAVARALLHLRGFSGGLGLWGSGGPWLAEAGGVKKILVRTSTELISLCMYRPR